MLKHVLYRTDRNRYICSKVTASFAAGLLTLLIGALMVFLLLFYPKQWIACTWEWPLGDEGVCLWMLLLSGIVFLMTMLTGRRLLERVA